MLSAFPPTINQNWTTTLAATHGLMSHHADVPNIPSTSAKLMSSRTGSYRVPVVEIPVRKHRQVIEHRPTSSPLRAPSPIHPRTHDNVASSSSSSHSTIALPRLPSIRPRPVQEDWTLQEALKQARPRLRPIKCQWAGCDAVLASLPFLKQHLERHLKRQQPVVGDPNSLSKCPWGDCKNVVGLGFVQDLKDHIVHAHYLKLKDTYCPFKACPYPEIPFQRTLSTHHYSTGHPKSWIPSSLRPHPHPRHARSWSRPLKPDPIPPSWEVKIYPFLATVRPYIPRAADSEPALAKTRFGREGERTGPPALKDLEHPISVDRSNPNEYFWPMRGDAPAGWDSRSDAISSTIFRHPCFHDSRVAHDYMDGTEVTLETSMRAQASREPVEPEQDNPFDTMFPVLPDSDRTLAPLILRPRPDRRGLQLLPDAEMFNWGLEKKRKRVEEPVDRKGKGKADAGGGMEVDDPKPHIEQYPRDLVVRASKRLARKNTGWSVGIGHWRERLYFERKGQQLGELPEWHQV